MERTLALIAKAHQGDKEARNTLVEENIGLVYTIVRRFLGRGIEMEDPPAIQGLQGCRGSSPRAV